MNVRTVKKLERDARRFFIRARTIKKTSRYSFAAFAGVENRVVQLVFPQGRWREMQDEWLLGIIRKAMDEVFDKALHRQQFSVEAILRLVKQTGLSRCKFMRLAGNEWAKKRRTLLTAPELVLATLDRFVENSLPPDELNIGRVTAEAGAHPHLNDWFTKKLREARLKLLEKKVIGGTAVTPSDSNLVEISGCRVDPDEGAWDLRPAGGSLIERRRLRKDLAGVAWSLMRDDLLCGEFTAGTVSQTFRNFIWAGEMLKGEVKDVSRATLDQVQRAWKAYAGSATKKRGARAALLRTFSALFERVNGDANGNANEMLSVAAWIGVEVSIPADKPCEDALSGEETEEVLAAALEDIRAGVEFTDGEIDLTKMTTSPQAEGGADPVVRWGTALMILTMLFTGIRRQSVLEMRVGDWAEVHKGLYALIWRHGKKREEKLGILPTSLARLLDLYVGRTQKVRDLLKTDRVFLMSDNYCFWCATNARYDIRYRLYLFVKQHGLNRDGKPVRLHCTMLRRTFTTRELYRGRSVWALQLQLGHESIVSTRRYGQFDRFEHPGQVMRPLDRYAKRSLTLWRQPVMLGDLPPEERARLLDHSREQDQEVGLCRGHRCLKLNQGGALPPCSLCEHLATGIEFLPAWEAEKRMRERKLEALRASGKADPLLGQEESEYRQFMTNFALVGGRVIDV